MTRTPTRLGNLLALAHYGGPPHAPRSATEWLRSFSFAERVQNQSPLRRTALQLFAGVMWPYVATRAALSTRPLTGESKLHRAARIARTLQSAFLHHVPPVEFAAYNFHNPATRANAAHYIYWTDSTTLGMLNRLRGANIADANDKARFATVCHAHGLPHIPTLANFAPGRLLPPAERDAIETHASLWVKAIDLNASRGAEPWTRTSGLYSNNTGLSLTLDQLIGHLSQRTCIVQPRMTNHPDLDRITNGRLASLRVVTVRKRSGPAVVAAHLLGVPRGQHITTTGGIGLHVGADGRVDAIDPSCGPLPATHLDTNVEFVGHTVPFFAEALALAQHAHTVAFPLFASLGWDIAITPDGPALIETNTGWGALSLQAMSGPLGLGPLNDVLEEERALFESTRS